MENNLPTYEKTNKRTSSNSKVKRLNLQKREPKSSQPFFPRRFPPRVRERDAPRTARDNRGLQLISPYSGRSGAGERAAERPARPGIRVQEVSAGSERNVETYHLSSETCQTSLPKPNSKRFTRNSHEPWKSLSIRATIPWRNYEEQTLEPSLPNPRRFTSPSLTRAKATSAVSTEPSV